MPLMRERKQLLKAPWWVRRWGFLSFSFLLFQSGWIENSGRRNRWDVSVKGGRQRASQTRGDAPARLRRLIGGMSGGDPVIKMELDPSCCSGLNNSSGGQPCGPAAGLQQTQPPSVHSAPPPNSLRSPEEIGTDAQGRPGGPGQDSVSVYLSTQQAKPAPDPRAAGLPGKQTPPRNHTRNVPVPAPVLRHLDSAGD